MVRRSYSSTKQYIAYKSGIGCCLMGPTGPQGPGSTAAGGTGPTGSQGQRGIQGLLGPTGPGGSQVTDASMNQAFIDISGLDASMNQAFEDISTNRGNIERLDASMNNIEKLFLQKT